MHPELILAPMRSVTTVRYRTALANHFQGIDQEMAPFIPTVRAERIKPSILNDVLPENGSGLPLIPQVIGNDARDWVLMAHALHDLGYDEVNWNLGCPCKPIRNKQRGAGLLAHPELIDVLLEEICANSPCAVSVKVRLGVETAEDLMTLIPIFNQYPLKEITIHCRTAVQMYNGHVDLDAFEAAYKALAIPVCYNGDIVDADFFQMIQARFPRINRFMLGRGLIANPFLCEQIKGLGFQPQNAIERLLTFHDEVLHNYEEISSSETSLLGKMKEFWSYPARHLSNGTEFFDAIKTIRRPQVYQKTVERMLADADWMAD